MAIMQLYWDVAKSVRQRVLIPSCVGIESYGKKNMFQSHNSEKLDAIILEIYKEKENIVKSTLLSFLNV